MAISFVGSTAVQSATGTEPTGAQEGDLLVAIISNDAGALSGPTGWSQVGVSRTGGTYSTTANVWTIFRGASAPSLAWGGTTDAPSTYIMCLRGADSVDDSATSAAGSALAPSVTAAVDDSWLVCLLSDSNWSGSFGGIDPPASMVDRTPAGDHGACSMGTENVVAGATGTRQFGDEDPVAAWSLVVSEPASDWAEVTEVTGLSTSPYTDSTVTVGEFYRYELEESDGTIHGPIIVEVVAGGIRNIYVGDQQVQAVYIGTTEVLRVYEGSDLIHDATT